MHLASLCMLHVAQMPESPGSTVDADGEAEAKSVFFGTTLHFLGPYFNVS